MAQDKQNLVVTLLIINTVLLVVLLVKLGCPMGSNFCPIGKKGSGYNCPMMQKNSAVTAPAPGQ